MLNFYWKSNWASSYLYLLSFTFISRSFNLSDTTFYSSFTFWFLKYMSDYFCLRICRTSLSNLLFLNWMSRILSSKSSGSFRLIPFIRSAKPRCPAILGSSTYTHSSQVKTPSWFKSIAATSCVHSLSCKLILFACMPSLISLIVSTSSPSQSKASNACCAVYPYSSSFYTIASIGLTLSLMVS